MTQKHDNSVCLRMPALLRSRLKEYAGSREMHLSAVIRMACADLLRKDASSNGFTHQSLI
jgi:hypothetical protein